MKAVIAVNGQLEVVDRQDPRAGPRQVLIQVMCTALNRADLLQATGGYAPPEGESDVLGLECSGVVVAVGENCTERRVGERVCALLASGGYAEMVAIDERLVIPLHQHQSWEEGAAIPEVWLTAYQLLHFVGRLDAGENVLVHAAASGVGTAAIQLARIHGAKNILATAGSERKLQVCSALGATATFNYKENTAWGDAAVSVTEGVGCHVILDPVGYPYVAENIKALGMDSRWVYFGGLGGGPGAQGMPPILGPILRKRAQLLGTTLRSRSLDYKSRLVHEFVRSTSALFSDKTLVPVLDSRSFDGLESMSQAHQYMSSDENIGKIVVRVRSKM